MRTQRMIVACLALGLGVGPGVAAQERPASRVTLALSAGASVPVGASRETLRDGPHVGLAVEVRSWVPWLAGRVDATFARFGWQTPEAALGPRPVDPDLRGRRRVTSGRVSAVVRVPDPRWRVRPYVVGGVGVSHLEDRFTVSGVEVPGWGGSGRVVRGGLHAGLGLDVRLGDVGMFAEGRYERVGVGRALQRTVPVSIGLRF